jgi:hypothetical protein
VEAAPLALGRTEFTLEVGASDEYVQKTRRLHDALDLCGNQLWTKWKLSAVLTGHNDHTQETPCHISSSASNNEHKQMRLKLDPA